MAAASPVHRLCRSSICQAGMTSHRSSAPALMTEDTTAMAPHPQDEVVLENEVCDAGHKHKHDWENSAPREYNAVGLRQLQQVGYLETSEVIQQEESQQHLHRQAHKSLRLQLQQSAASRALLSQAHKMG